MAKWLSPLQLSIVAGIVLVLLIPLFWTRRAPPSVDIAEVRRDTLVIRVSTNGTVEPIEDREIRARLDGRLLEIPEPGTEVRKGEVIVRIDAAPVGSELEAARSERLAALDSLRAARQALDRARSRFAVDNNLYGKGALTKERWQESRAALDEAKARAQFLEQEVPVRVASLDLRIRDLEEKKAAAVVTAPHDGTVYASNARAGKMVRAGDVLLRLADLHRLRVRTNVDQVDLGKVREGQTVRILCNAYPDREWKGRITEIIPNVKMRENRAVVEALVEVTSPADGLLPGMTVDVEIVAREQADVLQVPADAVFDEGEGPFVYSLDGDRVRKTPISVGLSGITAVEVTQGLQAGDLVVRGPAPEIADGMRVQVQVRNAGERS